MKAINKLISMCLAVIMIFTICQTQVMATTFTELKLDTERYFDLPSETKYYQYTPDEDGFYTFIVKGRKTKLNSYKNAVSNGNLYIYNDSAFDNFEGGFGTYGNDKCYGYYDVNADIKELTFKSIGEVTLYLSKGTTYYISYFSPAGYSESDNIKLSIVVKKTNIKEIESSYTEKAYSASDTQKWFKFVPEWSNWYEIKKSNGIDYSDIKILNSELACKENSSSNLHISNEKENGFLVYLNKGETYYIPIYSDKDGNISVKDVLPKDLTCDSDLTLSMENTNILMSFNTDKTGTYTITAEHSKEDGICNFYILDENANCIFDARDSSKDEKDWTATKASIDIDLKKGKIYYIVVESWEGDRDGNCTVSAKYNENIEIPSAPNVVIDYNNVSAYLTTDMEFSWGDGTWWTPWQNGNRKFNDDETGKYMYIRYRANGNIPASSIQKLYIPAIPEAPTGITGGTNCINNVDSSMEYRVEGAAGWIPCTDGNILNLKSGIYHIRYKATNTSFPSKEAEVEVIDDINVGESNLEITVPSFSSVEEGYERPEAKAITISNTGDADAEITNVEVDNTEAFEISGNGTTVGSNDSIDTYAIQPKEGLSAGIYNGTITVKYDNNKTATYDISFVVTEKAVVGESKLNVIAPSFSSVEEGYERPEAKAITISNTGDADAEITNVEVDNTEAFEISGNGTTVGSNDSIDTYTIQPKEGLSAGIYNGTVTVEYDNGKTATAEFTFTVTEKGIVIETQTPPSAPKLESRTKTSITLKKIKDNKNGAKAEYRIDGGKWQSSNVFKGLEPDTKYVFEVRYAAVDNFEASEPSEPAKISTTKKSSGGSGSRYTLDKVENSNSNTNKNDKPETKKSIFADVSLDNPNYDAIVKAYEKGYMVGTSENTFAPDGFLTRGMAAQIIWNIAGNPEPSDISPFLDVTSDMYYAKAVAWAYERGIILGYDGTKFGPDDFVTIEQFDIMMAKYNSEVAAPYTGVSPNATRGYVASRIAL